MLANGGYSDLDNPPAGAAMFNRDHSIKQSKVPVESGNEAMMSGMLAVVNTLCQAVLSHQSTSPKTSSPLKKAELRGTYFKQLGE